MSPDRLLHPRWDERVRGDVVHPPVIRIVPARGVAARVAIISDIHGNHLALQAVAADLDRLRPDAVVVGGDIAQGAPAPDQVVTIVRERGWPAVIGNADAFIIDVHDGTPPSGVPAELVHSARWAAGQLRDDHFDFLATLPGALRLEASGSPPVLLVHATPWSIEDVVLRDAPGEAAERMLEAAGTPVVAYGHIHSPYRRPIGDRLLLSVGAVSGSNDRDPRPAYTILTLGERVAVEVRRVAFDAAAAVAAVRMSGAPVSEQLLRAMVSGGPWDIAPVE